MKAREQVLKVLEKLPARIVRWAVEPQVEPQRYPSGIAELDALTGGGFPKGRISVLEGPQWSKGAGSIALITLANASRKGAFVALLDPDDALHPSSLLAVGADTSKVLWIRGPLEFIQTLKVLEKILLSRLFEVILVFARPRPNPAEQSVWVKLARAAEYSRSALIFIGPCNAPGVFVVRLESTPLWQGGSRKVLAGMHIRFFLEGREAETTLFLPDAIPWSYWTEAHHAKGICLYPCTRLSTAGTSKGRT